MLSVIFIYIHQVQPEKLQMLQDFFEFAAGFDDVFFVTPSQILQWMKSPRNAALTRLMPELACPPPPTTPSTEVCDGVHTT
jgi:hypothetical protein